MTTKRKKQPRAKAVRLWLRCVPNTLTYGTTLWLHPRQIRKLMGNDKPGARFPLEVRRVKGGR